MVRYHLPVKAEWESITSPTPNPRPNEFIHLSLTQKVSFLGSMFMLRTSKYLPLSPRPNRFNHLSQSTNSWKHSLKTIPDAYAEKADNITLGLQTRSMIVT